MYFFAASRLRSLLLVGLLMLPTHFVVGQERVRQSRSVDSFTKINYEIPGTLHLRQGEETSVEIEAPKRVLAKVKTTVDGDDLEIEAEGESGFFEGLFDYSNLEADEIDVYVTAPSIEDVTLAGSGRVVGETPVRAESLSLTVAGSGSMEIEVDANDLSVQVAGSGDYVLRGQASGIDANIAGSGDLRAADVEAQRAELRIAGSGDAELHVSDHLSAQIFGSGDVRYRGRPTVETNALGSGEVQPME